MCVFLTILFFVVLVLKHALFLPQQKMSFGRTQQLRELLQIIQEISKEIMWVNEREEEELVFDWGDKNIDQYIPKKQESYSVRELQETFQFTVYPINILGNPACH